MECVWGVDISSGSSRGVDISSSRNFWEEVRKRLGHAEAMKLGFSWMKNSSRYLIASIDMCSGFLSIFLASEN